MSSHIKRFTTLPYETLISVSEIFNFFTM